MAVEMKRCLLCHQRVYETSLGWWHGIDTDESKTYEAGCYDAPIPQSVVFNEIFEQDEHGTYLGSIRVVRPLGRVPLARETGVVSFISRSYSRLKSTLQLLFDR